MKADGSNFLEFIGQNKKTFTIPVFQRNYDWKKKHCDKLFEDVISLIRKPENTHFIGTIVYTIGDTEANHTEFVVIDGQQRLTTVMLLLKAINVLTDDEQLKEEIYEDFLTNKRAPEKYRLKLKTVLADSYNFEKIVDGEELKGDSNLIRNFKLFIKTIENSEYSPRNIYDALQRLTLVWIQLDRDKENPQIIFESLNSTGLDLTPADLIRNYLLLWRTSKQQAYLYDKYWSKIEKFLPSDKISSFIRDYLICKTCNDVGKTLIYESFKDYHRNNKDIENVEFLLSDLLLNSEYYSWFITRRSPNERINKLLGEFLKLKTTVSYPFLLELFSKCYYTNEITEDEVAKVLELLISYIFRRAVCDYPTNALNHFFRGARREVEQVKDDTLTYDKKLSIVLLKQSNRRVFPNNEIFSDSLRTKDFYNFKIKDYLFEKLELSSNPKEPIDINVLTIEHIMPQKLTQKWKSDLGNNWELIHKKYINCIGNLTLTGYNSELSNKSFVDKKEILSKSNLYSNRILSEYEKWGEKEINDRSNFILKRLLSLWVLPEVDDEYLIDDISLNEEFDIFDEIDVSGHRPKFFNIAGEKRNVASWREFFTEMCRFFYELDADRFNEIINDAEFVKTRKVFTSKDDACGKLWELSPDIHVQINYSANYFLHFSKLLVEKFGFNGDVTYEID